MACGPIARRRAPPRTSSPTSRSCARHWPPTTRRPASSPAGRGYELQLAGGGGRRAALRAPGRGGRSRAGRAPGRTALAGAALELWRGAPLADVASEPFAGPEIGRLEELHLRALELAIDAELAAGRHAEAIARLEALIAEEPLRERLHAQRMLALYRDGRQSEALEAYREARETLIEQIGVEPGPRAASACRSRSSPRTRASTHRRRSSSCRSSSRAARRCSPGASASFDWLRRRWGQAREGRVVCVAGLGAAGDRQDAARGRARSRGPGARAPRCSTPAVARSPRPRWRPSPRPPRATDRRCWCSTTPTTPRRAVLEAAAALAREPEGRSLMVCVLHHDEQGPPALRRPARERRRPAAAARPAGRGCGRRDRRALRARRGRRDAAARRWSPRATGCRFGSTARPAAGRGRRWPSGSPRPAGRAADDRTELRATEAAIAGGVVDLQSARERTRLYAVEEPAGSLGARGLPLPRPGAVRRRPRRVLLRPRAPGRRARRPPGRLDPARGGRPLGQRQVLGGARRPPAGARRRGRPRLGALAPGGDAPRRAPAGRALAGPRPGGARGGGRGRRALDRRRARPARARRAPGALDRPVRGGLRRLSRRGRARGVLRRAGRGRRRPRRAAGGRARDPRRLLRRAAPSTPSSRRW